MIPFELFGSSEAAKKKKGLMREMKISVLPPHRDSRPVLQALGTRKRMKMFIHELDTQRNADGPVISRSNCHRGKLHSI
jgi:hypothetical protein